MSATAATSHSDSDTPRPQHTVAIVRHAKIDEIPQIIKALKTEGCGNIFLRSTRFPHFGTLVVLTQDVLDKVNGKVLYTKTVEKPGMEPVVHDHFIEPFVLDVKDMPRPDRSDRALYLSTLPHKDGSIRNFNHKEIRDVMNNLTRRGVIPNGTWKIHRLSPSSLQVRFLSEDPKNDAALARIFLSSVSHTRVQWSLT